MLMQDYIKQTEAEIIKKEEEAKQLHSLNHSVDEKLATLTKSQKTLRRAFLKLQKEHEELMAKKRSKTVVSGTSELVCGIPTSVFGL